MTEPTLLLEGVDKCYRRGAERANLRAALPGRYGRKQIEDAHYALRNVSFVVEPQEIVGVIGPNGAGKSTLLKLIARVIAPTHGRVQTVGRVASLIELGVGFHPDLTGAENVRFSAAVLGMSRVDVERHYDAIVDFAGIERFMDTPVKRYSSGMLARLGFAVASHLESEIVLVDEVLTVGDADFQRRGYERMQTLKDRGATLLFVTHNLWLVPEVCQRAIRLQEGEIVDTGDPGAVVDRYQAAATMTGEVGGDIDTTNQVALREVRLSKTGLEPHDELHVDFTLDVHQPLGDARATLVFSTPGGTFAAGIDIDETRALLQRTGTWRISGVLPEVPLAPGLYRAFVTVVEWANGVTLTHAQASIGVSVAATDDRDQHGIAQLESSWSVAELEPR